MPQPVLLPPHVACLGLVYIGQGIGILSLLLINSIYGAGPAARHQILSQGETFLSVIACRAGGTARRQYTSYPGFRDTSDIWR